MVVELLVAYRNNIFSSGHLMKEHMLFGTFDQKKRIAYCSENVHTHGDYTNLASCSFNGKEKDYESGFHYYGARYYWSEVLTGWLIVDPMIDKYPNISPYAYCSWNPVVVFDPDGRDGVKVIDRQSKTITIKATYYVVSVPISNMPNTSYTESEIQTMQNEINATLNGQKYLYEYEGEKYNVTFDLNFKAAGTHVDAMNTAEDDPCGNYLSVLPESATTIFPTRDNGNGTVSHVGGVTDQNKKIVMNAKYDNTRNKIHEIFHTLYFNNDNAKSGIGSYIRGDDMPSQDDINKLISNPQLLEE